MARRHPARATPASALMARAAPICAISSRPFYRSPAVRARRRPSKLKLRRQVRPHPSPSAARTLLRPISYCYAPRMSKTAVAILLGALLSTSLFACTYTRNPDDLRGLDVRLLIIHTADVHSRLFPYQYAPN